MIVFVAGDDSEVFQELECMLFSLSISCVKLLQGEYSALTLAIQAIGKHQGVFMLSEKLARGFDLKFAVSAFVTIYAAKFYYMSSTI